MQLPPLTSTPTNQESIASLTTTKDPATLAPELRNARALSTPPLPVLRPMILDTRFPVNLRNIRARAITIAPFVRKGRYQQS